MLSDQDIFDAWGSTLVGSGALADARLIEAKVLEKQAELSVGRHEALLLGLRDDTLTIDQRAELYSLVAGLAAQQAADHIPDCWCTTCRPLTLDDQRFVVCPECGNKRCPRAHNHDLACTNSNAVGQPGSSWENVKPIAGSTAK